MASRLNLNHHLHHQERMRMEADLQQMQMQHKYELAKAKIDVARFRNTHGLQMQDVSRMANYKHGGHAEESENLIFNGVDNTLTYINEVGQSAIINLNDCKEEDNYNEQLNNKLKVAYEAPIKSVKTTKGNVILVNNPYLQIGDELVVVYSHTVFKITERSKFVSNGTIRSYCTDRKVKLFKHSQIQTKAYFDEQQQAKKEQKAAAKKAKKKLALEKQKDVAKIEAYNNRPEIKRTKLLSKYWGEDVKYDFDAQEYYFMTAHRTGLDFFFNGPNKSYRVVVNSRNYELSELVPMGQHFK